MGLHDLRRKGLNLLGSDFQNDLKSTFVDTRKWILNL